jgi:cellulose synthase operon protein C
VPSVGGGPDSDADLPAVKPPRRPDLPTPGPKGGAAKGGRPRPGTPFDGWDADEDLPAPKGRVPAGAASPSHEDPDLPVAKRRAASADPSADLPALKQGRTGRDGSADDAAPRPDDSDPLGGIDLPVAKGAGGGASPGDELDLPMPKARGGAGVDELDLPMPKARGGAGVDELDLPMPRGSASRGGSAGHGGVSDLPMPKGGGGLGDLDLPAPKGGTAGLDELDLPMTKGGENLPAPARDRADLPARKGQGDLPAARVGGGAAGGMDPGEDPTDGLPGLDLDPPGADELPLPEPHARASSGGLDLGDLGLEAGGEDGLEFDALPEEAPGSPTGPAATPRRSARPVAGRDGPSVRDGAMGEGTAPRDPKARMLRVGLVTLGALAVLAGAGLGLALTPHGAFGIYFFERFLPASGDPAQVRTAMAEADRAAAADTLEEARRGLRILADARREAGLNRELLAHSLLAESLFQVRFGRVGDSAARAAGIHARLEKRGFDAPGDALAARAAHALAQGRVDEAERLLGSHGKGAIAQVLAGEVALAGGHAQQAAAAFRRAAEADAGARAHWGIARALEAAGDFDGAEEAARATLEASPWHTGARVALARFALARGETERAAQLAREVAGVAEVEGRRLRAPSSTRASAWTVLGRIHEQAGERGQARGAYEAALRADAGGAVALVGLGRVLVSEGRARDALARFEAALEALAEGDHDGVADGPSLEVEAGTGAVQALLELDRVEDARDRMAELARGHAEDRQVLLWLGKSAEAAGAGEEAEAHYLQLIEQSPGTFDGYLALAQLHFAQGRASDAANVLKTAREQVPESAQVHRLIGESALERDRLDEAVREFQRALELDATDPAALFGLGVAFRRGERLDRAMEVLEQLERRDPAYPGLVVERGRIHEAQGRADDAVTSYRAALDERPGDAALMLRLASALVGGGRMDEAAEVLDEAMGDLHQSAEAEYLQGRVALSRDKLREAKAHFERAILLDGSRGDFRMYLARVELEEGSFARAFEAVKEALDRDDGLADAYWIRGRLRLRTGAVQDALGDLSKAVDLDPQRHEAHADMAETYDQLGKRRQAIGAYERALEGDDGQGEWWYRLGRLQLDAGQRGPANASLARATELGDGMEGSPGWLADAHRLRADALLALGRRGDAVGHYRRYLNMAAPDALDRKAVERKLRELGAVRD